MSEHRDECHDGNWDPTCAECVNTEHRTQTRILDQIRALLDERLPKPPSTVCAGCGAPAYGIGRSGSDGRWWHVMCPTPEPAALDQWWRHAGTLDVGTRALVTYRGRDGEVTGEAVWERHASCSSPGWVWADSPESCLDNSDITNAEFISDEKEVDERIAAWHTVVEHPVIKPCFGADDTLVDAMLERLTGLMETEAGVTELAKSEAVTLSREVVALAAKMLQDSAVFYRGHGRPNTEKIITMSADALERAL